MDAPARQKKEKRTITSASPRPAVDVPLARVSVRVRYTTAEGRVREGEITRPTGQSVQTDDGDEFFLPEGLALQFLSRGNPLRKAVMEGGAVYEVIGAR